MLDLSSESIRFLIIVRQSPQVSRPTLRVCGRLSLKRRTVAPSGRKERKRVGAIASALRKSPVNQGVIDNRPWQGRRLEAERAPDAVQRPAHRRPAGERVRRGRPERGRRAEDHPELEQHLHRTDHTAGAVRQGLRAAPVVRGTEPRHRPGGQHRGDQRRPAEQRGRAGGTLAEDHLDGRSLPHHLVSHGDQRSPPESLLQGQRSPGPAERRRQGHVDPRSAPRLHQADKEESEELSKLQGLYRPMILMLVYDSCCDWWSYMLRAYRFSQLPFLSHFSLHAIDKQFLKMAADFILHRSNFVSLADVRYVTLVLSFRFYFFNLLNAEPSTH